MTTEYSFTPSSLTTAGQALPCEYSITPSDSVIAFVRIPHHSEPVRVRFDPCSEHYAAVLQAAQVARNAPQPPDDGQEQVPATPAADEAPAERVPALPAASEGVTEAPTPEPAPEPTPEPEVAPPEAVGDPLPAAEAPAPSPKDAHGPVPEKTFIGETITGNGWRIYFSAELQRTQVFLDESSPQIKRLTAATCDAGFYYSPRTQSYNKKLTFRAWRAAQALSQRLQALA